MLLIDYSSAFNTVVPIKLKSLGLNSSLCNWILDFLSGRPDTQRERETKRSTTQGTFGNDVYAKF